MNPYAVTLKKKEKMEKEFNYKKPQLQNIVCHVNVRYIRFFKKYLSDILVNEIVGCVHR